MGRTHKLEGNVVAASYSQGAVAAAGRVGDPLPGGAGGESSIEEINDMEWSI
jgi:hypothetical protein